MVEDLKKGGTFLLNCPLGWRSWREAARQDEDEYIAENDINFYTIDGVKIGQEIGLGGRINTILQSAFFQSRTSSRPRRRHRYMKDAATKSYSEGRRTSSAMNHDAIDRGATAA